jgi:hypothetical protein
VRFVYKESCFFDAPFWFAGTKDRSGPMFRPLSVAKSPERGLKVKMSKDVGVGTVDRALGCGNANNT